ncbi:MAG: NAD(P)/FAD-dependent oxidoreductase [Thalassobaculum sp.]|uniref:flavin-containing monooxygenase n=1 Tax=Thalassobaculum sp. TaxID=2022740 RepID=UPI0032ECD5D7
MPDADVDVAIVGAGFAGLYMLHRLRGMGFRAQVLEAGSGVGGTWYWNRYPGARCDVESIQYSYQFDDDLQQEWEWSERYATQPELLRYAEHVADRFDLRRDIRFDTRVAAATFDEAGRRWVLETEAGDRVTGTWCVMATGCLSSFNTPDFPGRDSFDGATYHTGRWPHEGVDFSGRRVAVIGTGSSAIQSIPIIAEQAEHLTVFQRTANYTIPAHNTPLDPEAVRRVKADYPALRAWGKRMVNGIAFHPNPKPAGEATAEERRDVYERRWAEGGLTFMAAFGDLMLDDEANATAADFVRGKIREIVTDPETAGKLCPTNIIGCKRLCVDTGYYATYNRPNVTLVDISEAPIEAITPAGVKAQGVEHAVDAIVFATGFDAMTGALTRIDIRGAGGVRLRDKWRDGPRSYLGLAVAGFPNLFTVTGPGSPSVLTNMLPSIEQHVEWISDCFRYLRGRGIDRIEATVTAEDDWVAHNAEVAGNTLRSTCSSWYVGANVPGKPRVFMPYIGGFPAYVERCDAIAAKGYEGFALGA